MMITNLNYYLKYEEGDKITDKELRVIKNVANVNPFHSPYVGAFFLLNMNIKNTESGDNWR